MGMSVDEARRNYLALGVNRSVGGATDGADLGDATVFDGDVTGVCLATGPVDNDAVLHNDVMRHAQTSRWFDR